MVSGKTIIFLLLSLSLICGCFFAVSRSELFFSAAGRHGSAALPGSPLAAASLSEASGVTLAQDSASSGDPSGITVEVVTNGSKVVVSVVVFDAQDVLLYLEGETISSSIYLGKASYQGDGIWLYEFDLNDRPLPNGSYRVYARITKSGVISDGGSAVLDVDIKNESESPQKKEIEKIIRESNSEIEINRQTIAQAVQSAIKEIGLKIAPAKADENISLVAQITQDIEQLDRELTEAILERQRFNELVRQLEGDVDSLAENTLAAIKSEKIKELGDIKYQVRQLDLEISGLQDRINGKRSELETASAAVIALVPDREKDSVARILADMEEIVAQQALDTIAKQLILARDNDNDGLSDAQEILAGTNPADPDSDGDGALDGDEVARGSDPLVAGGFSRIDYGDPRQTSPKKSDIYKVEKMSAVTLENGRLALRFEGTGLPNSYVTLFIYSVPIVAIVKTDSSGLWNYELDQALSDGQHAVYAALVDISGQVVARSEQFVFTKNGDTVVRTISEDKPVSLPPSTDDLSASFGIYLAFIILLSLAIALLVIGFATREHKNEKDGEKRNFIAGN